MFIKQAGEGKTLSRLSSILDFIMGENFVSVIKNPWLNYNCYTYAASPPPDGMTRSSSAVPSRDSILTGFQRNRHLCKVNLPKTPKDTSTNSTVFLVRVLG